MACPFVAGEEIKIRTSRHTARHAKDGVIRFITITPGQQNPNRMCWSIAEAVVADVRSYVTFTGCRKPNLSRRGSTSSRKIGKFIQVIDEGNGRADESSGADFCQLCSYIV